MKLRFYIFKRLRNILRKRRIYRISLSLSMIITLFFSTLIYFSFNDYFNTLKEPILVSNSENSSELYNDVLQDKVEKYRELYAKEYDEVSLNDFDDYKQPTQTNIKFIVDEIYDINELNSTFMASGYIEALWDDSAIQRFDLDDNEDIIHKMSRRDILSTSNLSFYDSENQLYEKVNLINGDKESSLYSNFSKYRFKGRFRMERDMRRFPFDRSILKIRLNHALKAPDVFLWSDTDSVIIDPNYRINSYKYLARKCYSDDDPTFDNPKRYECVYDSIYPLYSIGSEFQETSQVSNEFMEAYEKLDYGTYTEIEGKIFRSPSSSFFRYLAPLLFGVLVLSIIEHLDERFSELRVATPPTILLTFIFMHSGYQSQIPQLSYITFMDKIFFLCYFLALISLISAVVSMNKHIILNRYLNKYMRIDFSKLLRFIFATSAIFLPFIMYYFV